MPQSKTGTVLARDADGRAFTLDPGDPRVMGWERPRQQIHTAQGGFLFNNLYLLEGQWYRHSGLDGALNLFPVLSDAPNYALPVTREQARDWFLAAGLEIPDLLADLVPAAAPPAATATPTTKAKRSTESGEALAKIIAALSQHHRYEHPDGLLFIPIGSNALAKKADVGKATASAFFKTEFGGHREYRAMCEKNPSALSGHLGRLNGRPMSHYSYGRTPPGEGIDEDQTGA
jgi:hypothetical protein